MEVLVLYMKLQKRKQGNYKQQKLLISMTMKTNAKKMVNRELGIILSTNHPTIIKLVDMGHSKSQTQFAGTLI